ncbi:MAG TPA: type I secretion system permease/ATPase, partial [Alphaproteobacteria bacterium]|nr:type I secretion system permease/ATPase [Alphaproteobacteria bacterium]
MRQIDFAAILSAARRVVWLVALFSLGINILMLTAPLYMLQVYDRVLTSRSSETLLYLTLAAAIALLTLGLLEAVRSQIMIRLGSWIDRQLSGVVLGDAILSALRQSSEPSVQGLRDLSACRVFLSSHALFAFLDVPWMPIFIAVVFLLHPVLGWIAVAGALTLVIFAIANEVVTRVPLRRSADMHVRATEDAAAAARNADAVQAMGMLPAILGRWERRNNTLIALQEVASLRSGRISALAKFLRFMLQVAVLGAGAKLVLMNEITPGAMIAASILVGRALAPIDMTISSWKNAVAAWQAWRRVSARTRLAQSKEEAMPLPAPRGVLKVEKLMFGWPGATEPLLRNVDFSLAPGQFLGVIGPTAAGKTTLARLIVGNLKPTVGHVRLDGADVADWDADHLGPYLGYLPQDVELFSGTVRENIARMQDADADAVIAAARRAMVHELILSLPQGYETEVGPAGAVLSGGQRQRIALARALFGDPRLVVLDEPSANLDTDGEAAFMNAVAQLKDRGVSIVIITHRPSILRLADRVLVLRNGIVERFGPRDEVMAAFVRPRGQAGQSSAAAVPPAGALRD